jgi:ElaB/YqjD/DUF883 family membrane-anchored ribosome-binding protein
MEQRTTPSHHNEPWTLEEVAELGRLAARPDTTAREIGRLLGRTERAVRSKASKENISLNPGEGLPSGRLSEMVTATKDYLTEKVLAGVSAYTRANTGQAVLIAAGVGCALGVLLGGGWARKMRRGSRKEALPTNSAEKAIGNWEDEGGAVLWPPPPPSAATDK